MEIQTNQVAQADLINKAESPTSGIPAESLKRNTPLLDRVTRETDIRELGKLKELALIRPLTDSEYVELKALKRNLGMETEK